jgi:SAM-dependent methyltransferase
LIRGGKAQKIFAESLHEAIREANDVLDIGTSMRFAKELRPYERLFDGKHYVAAGYQPSMDLGAYSCDCHQDIHHLTFADGSFDAVLCIQVLEHVANPFQAAGEIRRVLRAGGSLFVTVPFLVQYHGRAGIMHAPDHEHYSDYWRFTHQGLAELFSGFRNIRLFALDGPVEFRLKQFYLEPFLACPPFRALVDLIDRPRVGKATTRHLLLANK